jgi:hypothetical protein
MARKIQPARGTSSPATPWRPTAVLPTAKFPAGTAEDRSRTLGTEHAKMISLARGEEQKPAEGL